MVRMTPRDQTDSSMKPIQIVVMCSVLGVLPHAASAALIKNGSFENGLTSWTTFDLSSPFQALQVRADGVDIGFGFFVTTATDGSNSISTGFDGNGPGTIVFAQDVGEVNMFSNILTFDYRAGWNMFDYAGSTQDRVFYVRIRPGGGGTPLASFEVLRAPFGTVKLDTGPQTTRIDLSQFIGTSVRLSFDADIPENFTGPALLQVDNVRLVPEPGTIVLLALSGIAGSRGRRK
jgi:PEP-CTERM motif